MTTKIREVEVEEGQTVEVSFTRNGVFAQPNGRESVTATVEAVKGVMELTREDDGQTLMWLREQDELFEYDPQGQDSFIGGAVKVTPA